MDIQDTGDWIAFDSSLGSQEYKNNHLFSLWLTFEQIWSAMPCSMRTLVLTAYIPQDQFQPLHMLNSVPRPA